MLYSTLLEVLSTTDWALGQGFFFFFLKKWETLDWRLCLELIHFRTPTVCPCKALLSPRNSACLTKCLEGHITSSSTVPNIHYVFQAGVDVTEIFLLLPLQCWESTTTQTEFCILRQNLVMQSRLDWNLPQSLIFWDYRPVSPPL